MNTDPRHDRETVFQLTIAMAFLWALCWMFLQWEVPQLPPVTANELQAARQHLKP